MRNETTVTIPLTFDWLTLAWMKTRLALWWRGRPAPRAVLALLLGVLSGCVPVTRFEETQSAAQVEMEGRRRSEQQRQQLEAENAQLRAQMQEKDQALDDREQQLSQAALDSTTQGKQREDAEGIVQQLRGELQRVGSHLQAFHDEKQKLEAELGSEAARAGELSRLTRDLSLLLSDPIASGEYTLDVDKGGLGLRVPRSAVFSTDASVKPEAEALLKAVSKVMSLHRTARLRLEDSSAPGDAIAVQRLVTALTERAVGAERFEPLLPDAAAPQPGDEPEILFGFSVP